MKKERAVILLGASGSVGQAVFAHLLQQKCFTPMITLVRRPQPERVAQAAAAGVELRETLVPNMQPAALEEATLEALSTLSGEAVAISALGVGAGTGGLSLSEHRAIDVDLNAAFARALKANKRVQHLALLSAVGADPTASTKGSGAPGLSRFARVKGEAEEAVKAVGPAVISVFRPAMILGSQHTPWLLEKVVPAFAWLTPSRYRSITVKQLAAAMVATLKQRPVQSAVYHFSEMIRQGQDRPTKR